jgi:hypothetical protein
MPAHTRLELRLPALAEQPNGAGRHTHDRCCAQARMINTVV